MTTNDTIRKGPKMATKNDLSTASVADLKRQVLTGSASERNAALLELGRRSIIDPQMDGVDVDTISKAAQISRNPRVKSTREAAVLALAEREYARARGSGEHSDASLAIFRRQLVESTAAQIRAMREAGR